MSERVGALYLHVPFCARKCAYCDFASLATNAGDATMVSYVDTLRTQLARLGTLGLLDDVRTAYVGGGTPTLLGPVLLSSLVTEVRRWCPGVVELTCEANPDSLTEDVLFALCDAGATRVSIGVQSLCDEELESLGRIHDAKLARRRVRAAVASALDVSVDLMCAIPRQTDASWRRTLNDAVGLNPDHVSVYPLAIEEGTPFDRRYGDEPEWNSEDVQAERMEAAAITLAQAGYSRYEVASYAKEGKACLHNQAYWTGVSYIGLGHAAASMLDRDAYLASREACPQLPVPSEDAARVRMVVTSRVDDLTHNSNLSAVDFDLELLNSRQAIAEDLMLGMRMSCGVCSPLAEFCPTEVWNDLCHRGFVVERRGCFMPTHRGWLLGNELYGRLWELAGEPVRETSCQGL